MKYVVFIFFLSVSFVRIDAQLVEELQVTYGGESLSTNTVQSTIVSTLDSDSDGSYFWEDCNDEDPRARPNGVELPNNDVDEDCDGIVEYFTEENCNILSEDFNTYQAGGFTLQTDGGGF